MRARHALTLVEVLLVLALLVVLASLAGPALVRPFAGQRLRAAADQVRTEWAAARLEAIKSGRVYVFRYVPGTGDFSVESQVTPEAQVGDGAVDDPEHPGVPVDEFDLAAKVYHLPEGVIFAGGESGYDSRAQTVARDGGPIAGPSNQSILFFADGTATSAVLSLENREGSAIELSLRGITGVATVGRVMAVGGGP